jgi:predicted regulator of Ras-like GTPase activity (Roadblock/LC7/MglB family)
VDTGGNVRSFTSVAIGADGLPVVSYYDQTNTDLKVAHCGNASCSAGNTLTTVDSVGNVGFFTSIAIGADGLPVVSYWDLTNRHLKVVHCGDVSCSGGDTLTAVDTGNAGQYTSIPVGTDGLPVVSYYDEGNIALKMAHCGNASCSSGNTLTLVDPGAIAEYTSIAIGIDGNPVVSYYEGGNGDLKVGHCGNQACSSGNSSIAVDTAGDVGQYTSVAIGTDGLPVVSYHDSTNSDLKVVHCGNGDCSSGNNTLTAVDTGGGVGRFTGIAVGTDGLPIVTYFDITNSDLKIAHCGNAACSSGNTLTTLDTGGVGQSTSIAIDTDGLPVISYRDVGNQDLKVARPPVG